MKKLLPIVAIVLMIVFASVAYHFTKRQPENIIENTATVALSPQANSNAEQIKKLNEKTANITPQNSAELNDGFVFIQGQSFQMGSPISENWRIDDERQHSVTVSDFYISPYETTQQEYQQITGENPSERQGVDLPVENVSWLDSIVFANLKSVQAGLQPAYEITENSVIWDRSANGYRLPTEAEWEYATRAGTSTPFNMAIAPSGKEANFYADYPYEIEENYFDNSKLKAKPQRSRYQTIAVGSFAANAFGLYDTHGNVNEWCWDFYGAYDTQATVNPTGVAHGTRHVYRGGGWNDFGKNLRSAYRGAGQSAFKSHNLGIRLVRNAQNLDGKIEAKNEAFSPVKHEKILIVFYSWGGNTRGVAREIQKQTGADLLEIQMVKPYSDDYNTCLMQAQDDQHTQKRPKLAIKINNFEEYDTVLLGYPNWWASIPMPVATLLEEYDFSGKMIIPFASHGGGRMGQSVSAIAKLAPNAPLGNALSVHYSGGSTLPQDVTAWLNANGIPTK